MRGRVLVVDDELPNRLYIQKVLEKRGCEVLLAPNGSQGILLAHAQRPDLALVDVVMPEIDGYQVCRQLKEDDLTQNIPVIIVTAKTRIEDLERAYENGAVDYIRKPFNPRELVARVRTALALKQAQDKLRQWQDQMSEQLKLAGVLQQSLFDPHPQLTDDLIIRKASRPCEDVGGDVFDVIPLPHGRYAVYVADVCGHGVGPAIITALLKAVLFSLMAVHAAGPPHVICNSLNQRFRQYVPDPSFYATFFLAIYDPAERQCRCLSCGHPPPILVLPGGFASSSIFMQGGGMPIGFVPREQGCYREEDEVVIDMTPGAVLFLYTDGLIEAPHRETGEECGIDGLTQAARVVLGAEDRHDWAEDVLAYLDEQGYELGLDDCSAIAIRMMPPDAQVLSETVPATHEEIVQLAIRVERVVLDRGWPEVVAAAIQLLVLEHGMNIIRHGHLEQDSAVELHFWIDGDIARLFFIDHGNEWEHESFLDEARMCDDTSESGRGLAILKNIAVRIDLFRRDRRNMAAYTVKRDYVPSVPADNPDRL